MRLGDWIIERVEAHKMQKLTTICIPAELSFADLKLARDADGAVSFDTAVINRIEAASGLPDDFFMGQDEDAVSALIVQWYKSNRATGGEPDATAEDLIGEVRLEDARGGGLSHQPGRA
jgi:hypothetical protein